MIERWSTKSCWDLSASAMTQVQIFLTPTPSYFESNWYPWFRRQYRNYCMSTIHSISVHGQIPLQYKLVCYTLYKFVCVNVYIEGDLPFSLPHDKTWRIIVSVICKLHIYFFILQTLECWFTPLELEIYNVLISSKSETAAATLKSVL